MSAFLPDSRFGAMGVAGTAANTGYWPNAARVWDVATGQEVWASSPQRHPISALAFAPDGRMLASGSWNATAVLWDLSKVGC